MSTVTITAPQVCERCHHDLNAADPDVGFGYSREPDTTATRPEPVPAGVEMHFFTGRTLHRAAA